MDTDCDLEVDVNGEEVFLINKSIISSYSGRVSKLFVKSKGVTGHLKVIFNDFPGGAANFELITRFCYNNGNVNINPSNIFSLICASHFMEMNKLVSGKENLCELTEKSLQNVQYWSWSELMLALKKCQDLLTEANSSCLLHKLLDFLIGRIALSCETSPCPSSSSPDSSGFRLSCDSRSTESLKNGFFRATWWFEDLASFDTRFIVILVKLMVSRNIDHGILSKFIFYYQKSRFVSASMDEKIKIIETVIEMLYSLDIRSVSNKNLFGLLRTALNMSLSECCRNKLENTLGSQLDEATLDDLLVVSSVRKSCLYDVNLVLRFLRSFLGKNLCCVPLSRLNKVASLMDSYLTEIAPDPNLRPSKFYALITALPDSARCDFDGLYHAVNLYLEVHSGLSEEQKMKVCSGLNYEKLSSDAFNHLTRNTNFPSKSAAQALVSQQHKLTSLLQDTNETTFRDSPSIAFGMMQKDEEFEQIVIYAKKLDISDANEKIKAHLQGMQGRVMELEKACKKMQSQMTKMMKSRLANHSGSNSKSVPRLLCS